MSLKRFPFYSFCYCSSPWLARAFDESQQRSERGTSVACRLASEESIERTTLCLKPFMTVPDTIRKFYIRLNRRLPEPLLGFVTSNERAAQARG